MKKIMFCFSKTVILFYVLFFSACDMEMQSITSSHVDMSCGQLENDLPEKTFPAWSAEGDYVSFTARQYETALKKVPLYGNSHMDWTISNEKIRVIAISPSGTKVLCKFDLKNRWQILKKNGESFEFAPGYDWILGGVWSHCERYIVFKTEYIRNQLFTYSVNDRTVTPVFTETDHHFDTITSFCWSPDGRSLVITAIDSTGSGLFQIDLLNQNATEIKEIYKNKIVDLRFPDISPDGSQIVCVRYNVSYELFIMPLKGGKTEIIHNSDHFISSPVWSPDGKKIAFCEHGDIYILEMDTRRRPLCPLDGNRNIHSCKPVWSPDGHSLLIDVTKKSCNIHIASFRNNEYLTIPFDTHDYDNMQSHWFHHQSGLVFSQFNQLYRYIIGQDAVKKIGPSIGQSIKNLQVCPVDDDILLFDDGNDIFRMSLSDYKPVNLTAHIDERMEDPAWSPDGKQLICCVEKGLYICHVIGNKLEKQKKFWGYLDSPAWSPDYPIIGSQIAVKGYSGGIFIFSPKEMQPKLLIYDGYYPTWHPTDPKLGFIDGSDTFNWIWLFREIK